MRKEIARKTVNGVERIYYTTNQAPPTAGIDIPKIMKANIDAVRAGIISKEVFSREQRIQLFLEEDTSPFILTGPCMKCSKNTNVFPVDADDFINKKGKTVRWICRDCVRGRIE